MDIGSLTISLGVDTKGTLAAQVAIQQLAREVSTRTTQMNASLDTFNARLTQMTGKLRSLGWLATTVFTAPILMIGKNMMKAASEFEYSLGKIIGLVGVARDEVEGWGTYLLTLGRKVAQSPIQLADALFYVTSAGLRGSYAMEALEWSAKGATAGLGDTKVVADLVTSAMNAYGWEVLSAKQATDVLTATVREGKAEASALTSSMGMVLPIASEMGVSFNEVGAAMAAMTRTGTKASMSSVQLRQILVSLLKPSKQAQDALTKMGTSAEVLRKQIQEEGLLKGLMTLKTLTEKYGDALMARVFGNVRALTGALDLLGANLENNVAIFERMEITAGDTEVALSAVSNTIKVRMNAAMATMSSTMIQFGQILAKTILPMIERLSTWLIRLVGWYQNLNERQQRLVVITALVAAALGPLALIIGVISYLISSLIPLIKGLIWYFGALRTAVMANPILAFGIILAAWAAHLLLISARTKKATEAQRMYNTTLAQAKILVENDQSIRDRIKAIEYMTNAQLEALSIELQARKEAEFQFIVSARARAQEVIDSDKKVAILREKIAKAVTDKANEYYIMNLQAQLNAQKEFVAKDFLLQLQSANDRMQLWTNTIDRIKKMLSGGGSGDGEDGSVVAGDIFQKMMEQINIIDNVAESYKKLGMEYDVNKEKADVYTKAIRDLAELGFGVAGQEMKIVQGYMNELGQTLEQSKKKIEENKKAWEDIMKVFEDYISSVKTIQRMNSFNIEGFDANSELLRAYEKALQDIAKQYDKLAMFDTAFQMAGGVSPIGVMIKDLVDKINELKRTMNDTAEAEQWSTFITQLNNDLATNARKHELLGKKFNRATADINTYSNAITYVIENFDMADQKVVMLLEDLMRMQEIASEPLKIVGYAKQLERAFESAFSVIGSESENAFQAMADNFKQALNQMAAQMAAKAAMWIILSTLSGGSGALARAASSMLGGMKMGEYIGAGMAKGGIVPSGYPNDSFPAMLSSKEAVIPLSQLPNMIGGGQKMEITIKGKIDGKDIQFVLDEVNYLQDRTR